MLISAQASLTRKPMTGPTRAVVGPNAITQLAAALDACCGQATEHDVLKAAGLSCYAAAMPTTLVPESEAARLFAATRSIVGLPKADAVLSMAGSLTADYIIANRIPHRARQILQHMPPWLAARMLLVAIKAHAWTFAGSGHVTVDIGRYPSMTIAANPLATPGCHWHVAVLQGLLRKSGAPAANVAHVQASTADRFAIHINPMT